MSGYGHPPARFPCIGREPSGNKIRALIVAGLALLSRADHR